MDAQDCAILAERLADDGDVEADMRTEVEDVIATGDEN